MKTHYTAKELAGLPGLEISERAIRDKAKREGWVDQPRRGNGGGLEYSVSSLPPETRKALATLNTKVGYDTPAVQAAGNYADQIQLSAEDQERERRAARTESAAMFKRLPPWQRLGADAKLAILHACNHYITRHGLARTAGQDSFAYEYNMGRIDVAPWVRCEIRQLHPGTLREWIKKEHELGAMGLVDMYGNRKGQSKIETHPVLKAAILPYYFRRNVHHRPVCGCRGQGAFLPAHVRGAVGGNLDYPHFRCECYEGGYIIDVPCKRQCFRYNRNYRV